MMDLWTSVLDILILLSAALVLGTIFERLRQSPILGYLLAGTLLGPNALDLLPSHSAVSAIAELGVALLLFSIGLEFSWRRLKAVGRPGGVGGTLQVGATMIAGAAVCLALGLSFPAALAIGAMAALSSTAAVLRLLAARSEVDSVYGRQAIGVLLLQDIAVVPLVVLVSVLGGDADASQIGLTLGRKLAVATVLVVGFHLVLNRVLPPLLQTEAYRRNRDVPVLLAVVTAVGAAWVSYRLGFSPVLGAFIAGLLLGESRFATQIRADVAPLQVLFVTLFFSSIGMLSDPAVFADHWPVVLLAATGIVVGKTAISAAALRISGSPLTHALASGLVLAQVGEFSLVLADSARDGGLLDSQQFELFVAVLMVSLFATPFLVGLAPRVLTGWGRRRGGEPADEPDLPSERMSGHLLIVGFGPAGQRIAELAMARSDMPIRVLELNQNTAGLAESYGLDVQLGDATREEVLVHADVRGAAAVAITLPDPLAARQVVRQVRALAPKVLIAVRARYHIHRWQLVVAGAHIVVDEEDEVGARIASELLGSRTEPAGGERDSAV